MNIKHMFITILALLPLTSIFHINGMLIRTKALPILSQQQILQNHRTINVTRLKSSSCARSELVEEYPRALKDTLQQVQGERGKTKKLFGNSDALCTITDYNRERDEKIVSNIASNYLPELMSDVTPNSQHERLQELMTTINGNENISKVYLLNNKPIGFINYYIAQPYIRCLIAPHAHVNWLATDPAHQKKGIGSALLRDTLEECDKLSVSKITLKITDYSLEKYYDKFGFTCTYNSKSTGGQELTKRLQPYPEALLYLAIREWFGKFKE